MKILAIFSLFGFVFQLGASPCGCLHENFWHQATLAISGQGSCDSHEHSHEQEHHRPHSECPDEPGCDCFDLVYTGSQGLAGLSPAGSSQLAGIVGDSITFAGNRFRSSPVFELPRSFLAAPVRACLGVYHL